MKLKISNWNWSYRTRRRKIYKFVNIFSFIKIGLQKTELFREKNRTIMPPNASHQRHDAALTIFMHELKKYKKKFRQEKTF